jgi:hypothetical protein
MVIYASPSFRANLDLEQAVNSTFDGPTPWTKGSEIRPWSLVPISAAPSSSSTRRYESSKCDDRQCSRLWHGRRSLRRRIERYLVEGRLIVEAQKADPEWVSQVRRIDSLTVEGHRERPECSLGSSSPGISKFFKPVRLVKDAE